MLNDAANCAGEDQPVSCWANRGSARPADFGALATAQDLAAWAVEWIGAYGCERRKRVALIAAWPR